MSGRLRDLDLGLRLLRRDWRAGELRVLIAALVVAVAAVTSVGFFTDRIHLALLQQANELLGADAVITSDHPIREELRQEARTAGLETTTALSFPSMAVAGEGAQLALIEAVAEAYPLRGTLRVAAAPFAPDAAVGHLPARGEVWAEPRLLMALGLRVGESVSLGASRFTVAGVLTQEPGQGGSIFNIAPRVLMNLADVAATGLIQPASRVRYRLMVAGERADVQRFGQRTEHRLQRGESLQSVADARPELRTALERAERFLGLAALTGVLLAGVAVALAARRFTRRHLDHCAILRCLGATQKTIARVYTYQMLALGLAASILGSAVGFAAHWVLVAVLGGLLDIALPGPSAKPLVLGLTAGIATLLGFALPPLMQLKGVPALRVLRRELGSLRAPGALAYGTGVAALAVLMLWQAGDIKLGIYMVAGVLGALVTLAAVAGLAVWSLRGFQRLPGGGWRFGLATIARRPSASIIQVVAFGLGIMALLLLAVVRNDLLDEWQAALPDDAPNRFVINIQPDEVEGFGAFFRQAGISESAVYPMVRGRLVAINNEPVEGDRYDDERARHLVEREFNLSWTEKLAPDNRIVAGHWWGLGDYGKDWLSVEEGIATTLGIGLGDTLTYQVAGQAFSARVVSLREVDWDSFRANFFVVAPPGLLDSLPATYMTSFYLPPERHAFLNDLVRAFPSITVIDVAAIMAQVRAIMGRVVTAVEYVFVFTLLAGVMVLFAAIQSTHDERVLEAAIVRTLGGRRRQLLQGLWTEFVGLGLLAGIVAAAMATLLSVLLSTQILDLPYRFNPWVWLLGIAGGALVVGVAGMLGSRSVLNRPPVDILRRLYG